MDHLVIILPVAPTKQLKLNSDELSLEVGPMFCNKKHIFSKNDIILQLEQDDPNFILKHRSAPKGSLADEVLNNKKSLDRAHTMLTELRRMSIKLSDYDSCISTDDETSSETLKMAAGNVGSKIPNENSKIFSSRLKRKDRNTPPKESLLKKPNISTS